MELANFRMKPYPFKLVPQYLSKVWGGRRFEQLGRVLPVPATSNSATETQAALEGIGESWELADLASTAPSGGGGDAAQSVISNGPMEGKTLHDAVDQFGSELLGRVQLSESGQFPLLVKYLDAKENLSVQVHPNAAYAAKHPDAHLKSEAWYIIDANPGSLIYKGIQPGVTPQQFRDAIESNDADHVLALLIAVPARVGDCHYLPSGTCHALGAGVLVAEVQTPSDTTFRVFDWGRTNRELHIEQAIECIDFGPPQVAENEKRSHIAGMFTTISSLVNCEHFKIEKVRMLESYAQEIPYDQPTIWMIQKGSGEIETGNDNDPVDFKTGDTLLIPAASKDAQVKLHEDTVWLEIAFPKAMPPEWE